MPTTDPPSAHTFALAALNEYCALVSTGALAFGEHAAAFDPEFGLGGRLLFVGALNDADRALLVAANIAGAASLVVAEGGGKQALRDGVVDFLVSSLDEALRILKNEIRKRLPVSVAVSQPLPVVVAEMLERGVQPQIVSAQLVAVGNPFVSQGAYELTYAQHETLVSWQGSAQVLSRLDAVVLDTVQVDLFAERRWLRLAPRYLGRLAQGVRVMSCAADAAEKIVVRLKETISAERLDARVEIVAPPR